MTHRFDTTIEISASAGRSPHRRRSRRSSAGRRAIVAAIVTATLLPGIGLAPRPASARTCDARSTRPYFLPWGDPNEYFEAPNGSFEDRRDGWDLDGRAGFVGENEPWRVLGRRDRLSLAMFDGAEVTSDPICVRPNEDSVRLFVKSPGVDGAYLDIVVTIEASSGRTGVLTARLSGSRSGWDASPRIAAPLVAPSTTARGGQSDEARMTISFRPGGAPALWQVDDVLIDPWKTR